MGADGGVKEMKMFRSPTKDFMTHQENGDVMEVRTGSATPRDDRTWFWNGGVALPRRRRRAVVEMDRGDPSLSGGRTVMAWSRWKDRGFFLEEFLKIIGRRSTQYGRKERG